MAEKARQCFVVVRNSDDDRSLGVAKPLAYGRVQPRIVSDLVRVVSVAAGANFSEITSGVRDLIVTKGENTRWMSDDHFRMKVLPQMEDNVDCMRPDKIKLLEAE